MRRFSHRSNQGSRFLVLLLSSNVGVGVGVVGVVGFIVVVAVLAISVAVTFAAILANNSDFRNNRIPQRGGEYVLVGNGVLY